jgi:long-subunit fatty acid transport protein
LRGRGAALLALAFVLAGARAVLAANGAAPTCIGPRGPVSLPIDGDGQSMFRMPSGIAWGTDNRVDLDAFLYNSVDTVRNSLNGLKLDDTTPAGSMGLVLSGRRLFDLPEDAPPMAFGLGEYVHLAGGGTPAKLYSTAFPEGKTTTIGITFLTTSISFAIAPRDWISLGVSLHLIWGSVKVRTLIGGDSTSLNGSPKVLGVPLPGNPTYSDFLKIFSSDQATDPTTFVKSDLNGLQLGGVLSLSIHPWDRVGFGLAWAPRPYALTPFEGDADVDATRTFDTALSGLSPSVRQLFLGTLPNAGNAGFVGNYRMQITGLSVPQNARANVAVWPHERVLLAAEVAWWEWSRAIVAKARLTGGNNTDLNYVIGANSVSTNLRFNWSNQWVFSFQAAFMAIQDWLILRGGVSYGRGPIDANLLGNSPNSGLVDWTVMGGVGVCFDRFEINLLVEHGIYNSERAPRAESLTDVNGTYGARQLFVHLGVGVMF